MTYLLKVYGPAIKGPFGGPDVYTVTAPSDVTDKDGLLIVQLPPYPGGPATTNRGSRRPTGPGQAIYARGEWTKIILTERLVEPDQDAIDHYDRCHGPRRQGNYACCINPVDPRTLS